MSFTLILAVLLDLWLGEPKRLHPLVVFGSIANSVEDQLRNLNHSVLRQKLAGCFALLLMLVPLIGLVFFLSHWYLVNIIFAPVILYLCIAPDSLKEHAFAVLNALEEDDLLLARRQVAMIVSRQTDNMNTLDVRKATIESVLENGADAVFAPIFWFVVAGPAGAVMYRLSNTLDAMWGYKNVRYKNFGWAAARFDDVLNWIPARLTALTYALLGKSSVAISCWKNQAHQLDSPNAGPVMTSGAGALNIQLGGPACYHGKIKQKIFFGSDVQVVNNDIRRATQLIYSSLYCWIIILILGETLA